MQTLDAKLCLLLFRCVPECHLALPDGSDIRPSKQTRVTNWARSIRTWLALSALSNADKSHVMRCESGAVVSLAIYSVGALYRYLFAQPHQSISSDRRCAVCCLQAFNGAAVRHSPSRCISVSRRAIANVMTSRYPHLQAACLRIPEPGTTAFSARLSRCCHWLGQPPSKLEPTSHPRSTSRNERSREPSGSGLHRVVPIFH